MQGPGSRHFVEDDPQFRHIKRGANLVIEPPMLVIALDAH
jgi:hypothetical protein